MSRAEQVEVILEGVVGSTAYGMATPESDQDYLGVWRATTRQLLGLHPPVGKPASIVTHEPHDRQLHEVGKFVSLAMKANPTILELLWLPEHCVTTCTSEGMLLRTRRFSFLSNLVRNTYVGYAVQQIERAKRREDGSFASDLRKRTEKHGRHVARLLLSGRHALEHGAVLVELDEEQVEWCRGMGQRAADDLAKFEDEMRSLVSEIDTVASVLPDKPDEDAIEAILWEIRGV